MIRQERMKKAIEHIDALLKTRLDVCLGPGISLALTTSEGPIATRCYGVTNASSRGAVMEETLFQIGSITKHFTAVACMRLHQQGRLDVHDPVTDVLDWFKVQSVFDVPVTIHHLLTHTSGLIMMMDSNPSSWGQTWALRNTALGFEPGTQFSYSNVGYNVLQCVIQTITGKTFDASLRELIFGPLGMTETFGEIRNALHNRTALGHKYSVHDDRPVPRPERQVVVNWYELSAGCGSVVTTARDLARFLRMELNGGHGDNGNTFLSPESFEKLTHPYIEMPGFFTGTMQGYGVLVEQSKDTSGHRRVIGAGENLGYEAAMYGDIEAGLGAVLLVNSYDVPWRETKWILDVLLAAEAGRDLPSWPHGDPMDPSLIGERAAEYAGHYENTTLAFDLVEVAGRLDLRTAEAQTTLQPIWGDAFIAQIPELDRGMLSFGRNEDGTVIEAFCLGEHFRSTEYDGPDTFDYPEEWDQYVGQYRAFGVFINSLRFFIRKGAFTCQAHGGYGETPLTDLGNGIFRFGGERSPERVTFDWIAGVKALRCRMPDGDFYRVD